MSWDQVEQVSRGRSGAFDVPCPTCGPTRQHPRNQAKRVMRLFVEDGFCGYHCVRCGVSGWTRRDDQRPFKRWQPAQRSLAAAQTAEAASRIAFANEVWTAAGPLPDTPSSRYLRSRGLRPDADDLRHAWAAPYSYQGRSTGPALVAAYRAPNGRLTGIQVTHLDHCARKLRRTTFGVVANGGAVQLHPVDGGVLAVSEGTETGMAFAQLEGVPTWAALGAGGMANFQPPAGLERLVVAADHDVSGVGLLAARALAERVRRHVDVQIVMPSKEGDWADALQGVGP